MGTEIHAFTPGFNWWMVVVVVSVIIMVVMGEKQPLINGRDKFPSDTLMVSAGILAFITSLLMMIESLDGLTQLILNHHTNDAAVYADVIAIVIIVIVGTLFGFFLFLLGEWVAERKRELIKRLKRDMKRQIIVEYKKRQKKNPWV